MTQRYNNMNAASKCASSLVTYTLLAILNIVLLCNTNTMIVEATGCTEAAPCLLTQGISQKVLTPKNTARYYKFSVTDSDVNNAQYKEISVVLTKLSGQAEAYVTQIPPLPQPRVWSTVTSGSEVISLVKECNNLLGCHRVTAGDYLVKVQSSASTDSITRLVYSWNTVPIQVAIEDPQIDDVEYQAYEYFVVKPSTFGNDYQSIKAINIIKTSISGSSYVAIAYNVNEGVSKCTKPTMALRGSTDCAVKHKYARDASILIGEGDGTSTTFDPTKNIYIGVYGASSPESMYTILVTRDNGNVTLVDGMPQIGEVQKNARHFYRLETEGTHHKLTINANPQNGYISLYVNFCPNTAQSYYYACKNPTKTSYQWHSVSDGTGSQDEMTVTISPTTGNWRKTDLPGVYHITIYGVEESTYVLTATTSHNALTLRNGESMHEKVLRNRYEYFKIMLPAGQDLHIGVTAYGGDPDLYVSCKYNATQDDTGYPSLLEGHYGWKGWSMGNDVVTISAADKQSKCANQNTIYAAVHGFEDAVFTITALAGNDTVLELEDGRPVQWIVEQYKYARFAVYTGSMSATNRPELNLELTPTNCDVDLYVKYCTNPNLDKCDDATKLNHDKSSKQASGTENIVLKNFNADVKWVVIGVYGFDAGEFTMAAWTTSPLVLIEGQAVMGHVGRHEYRYFKFHVETPADVTITLTPLSGDVDLYVANGEKYSHPDKSICKFGHLKNETWCSRKPAMQVDVVKMSMAPAPYEYIIAVYGFRNSTYTIQGRSSDDSIVSLDQGLPQGGEVDALGWRYYSILTPAYAGGILRVVTSTREGQIKLYANKCVGRDCIGGANEKRPGKGTYANLDLCDVNSDNSFNGGSLNINVTSHSEHENGVAYVIGVHGISAHSEFTLTALVTGTHGHSLLMLQAGSAVNDFVEKDAYSYYRFSLMQSNKDLTFVVTPFSGDPDIYVSTEYSYPNRSHYTWAHRSRGRDAITIAESDPKACHVQRQGDEGGMCDYFIAIYGYHAVATYTIMAYLHDNTPKILQRGIPQSGHANQTESQYYQFVITNKKENIVVTVTPEDDGDPDLYILFGVIPEGGRSVSRSHYHLKSSNWREQETITINHNDLVREKYCNSTIDVESNQIWQCQLNILVYGYRTTSYDIVASTDDRPIRLRNWKPMPGTVHAYSSEYFEFDVDGTSSNVDTFITLTPYNGDVDLFVGIKCNFSNVDKNHYRWVSVNSGTTVDDNGIDSVTIAKTDPHRCIPTVAKPCRYCIKVKNYESNSVFFSITGGTDAAQSAEMLAAGSELNGEVDAKAFRYYIYQKNADNVRISFSVTATSGAVTMYVSRVEIPGTGRVRFPQRCIKPQCTSTYAQVDRSTYTWRSYRSHQLISVYPASSHFCTKCNYIVGVYNNGPGKARFTVSATAGTKLLVAGLPTAGVVNEGSYMYYKLPVTNPRGYLNVLVMPTNADGTTEQDLYVGFGDCDTGCNRVPTKTNYDAKSQQLGAECFFINLEEFCKGNKVDADGTCLVFFGVYGRKGNNGQYKILAELDNAFNSTIKLSAGEPLLGCVREQGFTYYQHRVDNLHASARVTITLTPMTLSSDPDLYVTVGENNVPTRSHADFRSYQSNGNDIIIVQRGDPKFKSHCPKNVTWCSINIGVYGFAEASFTITISTGVTETLLLSGVPTSGYVTRGGYNYYRFGVPRDAQHPKDTSLDDITIVLDTPGGEHGDPDLLVSNHEDRNQLPILSDHTSYQWHENSRGGGFIYISHTEKNYKYGNDFVIAVYGFTNATYTLLVNIGVQPTTLNIGQQIEGKALANNMQYYSIRRGSSTEDVVISVMPLSGRPFLYALATKDHQLPSTKHYAQSSRSYQVKSRNTVIMKNGTDIPPGVDTIIAGVFGYDGVATYKIRAQLCGKEETIHDAYAYHDLGACNRNDMSSFQYNLATPANEYNVDEEHMPSFGKCKLEIALTKTSGTPIFAFGVDPDKKPTCFSNLANRNVTCKNDIRSLRKPLESRWYDSFFIDESSPDFAAQKGKLYITAYSTDNAVYGISITRRCEGNYAPPIISLGSSGGFVPSFTSSYPFCDVEARNPRTRLCSGGASETRESSFYKFQVSKSDFKDQQHTISVSVFSLEAQGKMDDMLTMYVHSCLKSKCGLSNVVPGPNSRHDNVAGEFIPPDSLTYFIEGGENECTPTPTDNCIYYLGLYAQRGTASRNIPFGLKVYVSNSGQRTVIVNDHKMLVGGHAQVVCATKNCNKQLSFLIPSYGKKGSPKKPLHAELEVCQGNVKIETCDPKALLTDDCQKNPLDGKALASGSGDLASGHVVEMTLDDVDPTANTYMTAYGTGTFKFYLDRGCLDCKELVVPTEDVESDTSSVAEGVGLSLSWKTSTIKPVSPQKSAEQIKALGANYIIYLVEAGKKADTEKAIPPPNAVLYTPCGLQTLASDQPQITKTLNVNGGNRKGDGVTEVKIDDLKPSTHYIVTVVAVCDENCQKGNVNQIAGEAYDCDKTGKVLCKAYKSIKIVTGTKKVSYGIAPPIIITIILVVCCSCVGFFIWKRRVSNEQREQYQMQDVSALNFSLDSLNKSNKKKGSRYEPLVSGYDGDDFSSPQDDASLITHF